jgi:hypothetical protein
MGAVGPLRLEDQIGQRRGVDGLDLGPGPVVSKRKRRCIHG